MTENRSSLERSWREIAKQVSTERDSHKIAELSEALIQALDQETKERTEQMTTNDEEKSRWKAV